MIFRKLANSENVSGVFPFFFRYFGNHSNDLLFL